MTRIMKICSAPLVVRKNELSVLSMIFKTENILKGERSEVTHYSFHLLITTLDCLFLYYSFYVFFIHLICLLFLFHRLIRAMSCKFLALSATVGNADELRGWLERVRGDQLVGVECIDVIPEEPAVLPLVPYKFNMSGGLSVIVMKTLDNNSLTVTGLTKQTTVLELKQRIHNVWTGTTVGKQQLLFGEIDLINENATLDSYGIFNGTDPVPTIRMYSLVNVLTHQGRFINLQRYVWSNGVLKVRIISED